MLKDQLRKTYKSKRKELSQEEIDDKSLSISNRVLNLAIWQKRYFHLFLPIAKQHEVNTEFLLPLLKGKDKSIVISKTDFKRGTMNHVLLTDDTAIAKNKMGIPEPVEGLEVPAKKLDVVFVPLLAFDRRGHRVGYGGGFYDKFLSDCRSDAITIGLSLFPAVADIKDTHPGDIPLDYCITPEHTYSF